MQLQNAQQKDEDLEEDLARTLRMQKATIAGRQALGPAPVHVSVVDDFDLVLPDQTPERILRLAPDHEVAGAGLVVVVVPTEDVGTYDTTIVTNENHILQHYEKTRTNMKTY